MSLGLYGIRPGAVERCRGRPLPPRASVVAAQPVVEAVLGAFCQPRSVVPQVCSLPRRSSQNNSLGGPCRFQHAVPRAGIVPCRRPSASTNDGGGGRALPRTPSIAAASVVVSCPACRSSLAFFVSLATSQERREEYKQKKNRVNKQSASINSDTINLF